MSFMLPLRRVAAGLQATSRSRFTTETQQRRTLSNQGLPAHGSVPSAVAPWFSWRSSLLNRSSEDLLSGSVSLTRHSSHSSPKHSFAPARAIDVCLNPFGNRKTDRNSSSPKALSHLSLAVTAFQAYT